MDSRLIHEPVPIKSNSYLNFAFSIIAYFSDVKFSDLPLSEQTLKAVNELGYTKATEI